MAVDTNCIMGGAESSNPPPPPNSNHTERPCHCGQSGTFPWDFPCAVVPDWVMSLLSWLAPASECGEDTSGESDPEEYSAVSEPEVSNSDSPDHIPEIPEKAHQPFLKFPKRTFGEQQRAFCSSWYAKFPWLHYQEGQDKVYCFHCLVSDRHHYPISLKRQKAENRKILLTIFNLCSISW